jgi:heme exporter protein C
MFNYFANPFRFLRLTSKLQPITMLVALAAIGLGLFYALVKSPPDYQQSETVRIMYVHVPAAWMAMFCYVTIACSSAVALIWRHMLANIIAKSTAPIGASFTFLALATGSLWGKPMWGAWWVWDARLTSMLILFFLYLGYIVLYNAFDDQSRGARAAAILSIVGVINIPIIKFSVDWWNTLHQPASVIKINGPTVHPSMLTPLMLMAVGYMALYFWLLFIRTRAELNTNKVRKMLIQQTETY